MSLAVMVMVCGRHCRAPTKMSCVCGVRLETTSEEDSTTEHMHEAGVVDQVLPEEINRNISQLTVAADKTLK